MARVIAVQGDITAEQVEQLADLVAAAVNEVLPG